MRASAAASHGCPGPPLQPSEVRPVARATLPAPAAGAQQFALTVTWPEGSKASAICARLSVTPPAGGVGPLGTDYTVTSTCATTGTAPTLTATYNR